MTFNIIPIVAYLILQNPAWLVLALSTNIPVIGWIPLAIGGFTYWLFGQYGVGLLTAISFEIFITIGMALFFNITFGLAMLGAVLPIILIALPIGIIGAIILLAIISIPVLIITALLNILPTIIGVFATVILLWFLAPIITQLAVDPLSDFVAFVILVFTALQHPFLYFALALITVPATLLTFVGMFANWLNPLRLIFNGIAIVAAIGLFFIPIMAWLGITAFQLLNFLNPVAFWGFAAAKVLLEILTIILLLNTINIVVIPLAIELAIWFVVGLVTIFVAAFMSLGFGGIFNPANIGMWMYIIFAPVQVVFVTLITLVLMLTANLFVVLLLCH
ncbi:hypothetical protein [Secundilactobacillus kimchicus]|uniref:hypothetical protein n=1 Tax=Secundilactobacillus kimchicus TaxID=528209 RepID=UPI0006CF7E2D|nr:hypothetical protein [Secundilactobacillus kimchicus]